ncbi:MAG TPA: MFS transporter [Chthoniobacterales bacterium]
MRGLPSARIVAHSRAVQEPPPTPHDAYDALRYPGCRDYLIGGFAANVGRQMATVAVVWQIYQWTHSATALGLVGLINVLPLLVLSLPAGMMADRLDRKWIIAFSSAGMALLSLLLALVTQFSAAIPPLPILAGLNETLAVLARSLEQHPGARAMTFDQPALPIIYGILFLMAILRILGWPSRSAIIPLLVPAKSLSNAVTWNSSAFEISTMLGPAIGGFLLAWAGYPAVYVLDAICGLSLALLIGRVRYETPPASASADSRSLRGIWAGVEFIWNKKAILAASSLDLFAVLLGGAVALLPIYAEEILHAGPIGLGWLRAAPSIGAFSMALWLAHRRPLQQPGVTLLWVVAGFGLSIIVFGFSPWFWLSLLALFFTGVFDNISVVVRQSLVQLLTPDSLRGRVTAVNQIFIGSSNEIGTLRAGLMAAVTGPVAAVVIGGIGTIAVVIGVARFLPQLRATPALDKLKAD